MYPSKHKFFHLKTKIISCVASLILAVILVSFSDPYSIRRISDANFRYEFYTTEKKVTPKANKMYYWFKGGAIHNTQGGITGTLLHDKFIKMYHSNQLAEQGEFKNGLKKGIWKTWYPSGVVETSQDWSNGLKSGKYYHYDANGVLDVKGNYRGDKKQGKWIDFIKKDTIVYKDEVVVLKKSKISKAEKFKLKQESEDAKEAKKALQKSEQLKTATDLTDYKAKVKANAATKKTNEKALKQKEKAIKKAQKEAKGDSKIKVFLKKIWSKKDRKQMNHGQGK